MKKVSKKKLVTTRADDTVAPKWFQPAMQQVLKNYPTKDDLDHILEEKLKNYATKDDLKDMSEHLTSLILHQASEFSKEKLSSRFENVGITLGNHNRRILDLEKKLSK